MGDPLLTDFSVSVAGDAIITRPLRSRVDVDSRLREIIQIVQDSDVGVVNLETLLHDYERDIYPASADVSSSVHLRSPPSVLDELTWAGFDLFSAASNHTNDYTHGGMLATLHELEHRGVTFAGLGRNLAEARAPAYHDSRVGRVALVSACSAVEAGSEAGTQRVDMHGRPGLSPLRLEISYVLPPGELSKLKTISEDLGLEAEKRRRESLGLFVPPADGFQFLNPLYSPDIRFIEGDDHGIQLKFNESDRKSILRSVSRAKTQSDLIVFSLHHHHGTDGRYNDETIPECLVSFARDCVDNGADIVLVHGPHQLRGIEVYNNAPIFYSLANFIAHINTIPKFGHDVYETQGISDLDAYFEKNYDGWKSPLYFESILPVCKFADGTLDHIELHPIDLGFEAAPTHQGWPRRASDEQGTRILERLGELSSPFDTTITHHGGVGVIDVS